MKKSDWPAGQRRSHSTVAENSFTSAPPKTRRRNTVRARGGEIGAARSDANAELRSQLIAAQQNTDPWSVERELATEQGRLKWLVKFANRDDLLKLSPQQLIEVFEYLYQFARQFARKGPPDFFGADYEFSAAALFKIQDALRSGLRQVIRLEDSRTAGDHGWEVELSGMKRSVMRGRSAYVGPLNSMFLASVADEIANDRKRRIASCGKPTCDRFVWRFGRVRYCSPGCAAADRQKRYRNKHDE